jgi:hypothetical protein
MTQASIGQNIRANSQKGSTANIGKLIKLAAIKVVITVRSDLS